MLTIYLDSAYGFSVEYYNWYKVVTNNQLNERYALVCCDQPLDNFTSQYHTAINTPVNNVGIENVRDILPYMEVGCLLKEISFNRVLTRHLLQAVGPFGFSQSYSRISKCDLSMLWQCDRHTWLEYSGSHVQ